ncbi:MAG: hypothetical protein HY043_23775 [Verrucomicrobia bacterium]|nr:hypothetical protein [Verrucomicrobiota bacterium]
MKTKFRTAFHRFAIGLALVGALELLAFRAAAQLPTARLTSVFPPGGKAGTSFEVSVSGSDLDDTSRIYFSNTGIIATQKWNQASGQAEANKFIVTIPAEIPAGVYEARADGRFGISNPRAFEVGDRVEAISPATNRTASAAMAMALDSTVNGRVEANASDYFSFAATKGQRVLIECVAKSIDSRMEPVLVLFDAAGHELERERRGGVLDFTAPMDGRFVLQVHDVVFRGGEEFFYRLTASTGPRIDFIFPPAGTAGARSQFTLYGRNLPGGVAATNFTLNGKSLEKLPAQIELPGDAEARQTLATSTLVRPGDAALDGFEYRLRSEQGVSNPVRISFVSDPVVAEREPNDAPAQAQTISPPCEIAGQFYPNTDKDFFRFEARKGDAFWVEVFSQRLGLPTDPFLLIQRVTKNEKGEEETSDVQELYDSTANIGGPEFNTATRDPAARFEAKEDGLYQIEVRDLFNRTERNPGFVYRLAIRKETPDFRLVALPVAPPPANKDAKIAQAWTPFLRRGETIPIKVLAFRRDNFNGDIQLAVEGLPASVTFGETKIDASASAATVMLTASGNATNWVGRIRIVGRAKMGESEVVRSARGGAVTWTVNDYNTQAILSRMTRDFTLAVSGAYFAPLSVEASENKTWESPVGGKLQIPIRLTRREDFNDTVKLKAVGAPALDALKELEFDAKTTNATLELDLAQLKVPAGTHQFHLQAQTNGKYRRQTPEEFKGAEESVKQTEKATGEAADAVKKAKEDLTAATQALADVESRAKEAAEKFAAAKAAAEKSLTDEAAIAARTAAEKDAAEADAKLKAATEAKAQAEKLAGDADAQVKEATKKKEEAAKKLKEMDKKDATYTLYSPPIRVTVTAQNETKGK